jgi:oligopeptide/dipeptide ABC transporter ATP-binding protein
MQPNAPSDANGADAGHTPMLSVESLATHFFTDDGVAKAVDGVSFAINRGETLALVGESGCGKSVTSLSILRLVQPPIGRIVSGRIVFNGIDLASQSERQMRRIRGDRIAMIFQEPMTALNPVYTIGNQLIETICLHQKARGQSARTLAAELLERVGIPEAQRRLDDYPHHLSGGMRQRVMIAMALACEPELLIADEPTTALDVTIQAQILRLMKDLQRRTQMSILLITHDLAVVAETADTVAVMYAGRIVEHADVHTLFADPKHPYTQGLLAAIPQLGRTARASASGSDRCVADDHPLVNDATRLGDDSTALFPTIAGEVPNPLRPPSGCRFHPRCSRYAESHDPRCTTTVPDLRAHAPTHHCACWLAK